MLCQLLILLMFGLRNGSTNKMNIVLSADDDGDLPLALPLLGPLRPLNTESLHITSAIKSRYGMVHVTRQVRNLEDTAQEAVFLVTLPDTAFISNFSMKIKGKEYVGKVKEKSEARRIYNESLAKGQTAGHVEAQDINVRFSNKFDVAVNIEPREVVTFLLTYEELLERRRGIYEHVININAGQVIDDLSVEIFIKENKKFQFVRVPQIRNGSEINKNEQENQIAKVDQREENEVYVSYSPNKEQQEEVSDKGINGQLVVQYDLTRNKKPGDLQVENQYFVHFFAPNLQVQLKKHVVFVIDTSGSMAKIKLKQTKDALVYIFDQLKEDDLFSVVEFDNTIKIYNGEVARLTTELGETSPMIASPKNIEQAKIYIQSLVADGGTNINDALLQGLKAAKATATNDSLVTLVVFLTDGQPTSGTTDLIEILKNVKGANLEFRVPIFCLGFGQDANYPFLRKLSLQNYATARKIYEARDANTQLKEFFNEISSPLLSDIDINFQADRVVKGSIPRTKFGAFFGGSEFVITGKLTHPDVDNFDLKITARSAEGPVTMVVKPVEMHSENVQGKYVNFLERLWAYLNIKELLIRALETDDKNEAKELKKNALELSLKYNFVTQVTSMIVVQPDAESLSGLTSGDKGLRNNKNMRQNLIPVSGYNNVYDTSTGSSIHRIPVGTVAFVLIAWAIFK